METVFLTFWVTILHIISNIKGENCDNLGTFVYEDLGCMPHYVNSSKCPASYTCQAIGPWKNRCYFKGKVYNKGQFVDNTLTSPVCQTQCFCSSSEGRSDFLCATEKCSNPPWTGCFYKSSLDKCCPVGTICPSETNTQCSVDNHSYSEGQTFASRESCIDCVCEKGFVGKLEEPFCRRRTCRIEILYSHYIQNACAPLYSKYSSSNVRCCPDSWICDDGSLSIKGQATSDHVCMFGRRTLKVGQLIEKYQIAVFAKAPAHVVCRCEIPPLLTCAEI